jgi:acyl-CoA thioesterase-2
MNSRTLDHSLWFHRAFEPTDWLLFSSEPTTGSSNRHLSRGMVHDRDGLLVASFAQEGVARFT